ncbi:MAG TPA: antitoxin [Arachnia sp.]|nr:antitoxin [Arachnia sp.]HMT85317.1 antitoxin [Arachnia sp.]
MTNVLIRGLSEATVKHIDARAAELGLSRNEFLRRKLEGEVSQPPDVRVTADDWERSAAAFSDLADPAVMDAAWR